MEINFEEISSCLTAQLQGAGIHAVEAYGKRMDCDHCVLVVTLNGCELASSGLGDYLGELTLDEERVEELYGKLCNLELGLQFYAPVQTGEKGISTELGQVLSVLSRKEENPFRVTGIVAQGATYDREMGLVKRELVLKAQVYLYYLADSEETFMDIDIKGVLKDASK